MSFIAGVTGHELDDVSSADAETFPHEDTVRRAFEQVQGSNFSHAPNRTPEQVREFFRSQDFDEGTQYPARDLIAGEIVKVSNTIEKAEAQLRSAVREIESDRARQAELLKAFDALNPTQTAAAEPVSLQDAYAAAEQAITKAVSDLAAALDKRAI